ncbi:hypothetical protein BJV77DRAFT_1070467 [Russula vinacea]|nr:hypothetical protein BJV77DRAFT_1070467 [Russula vinacea]
MSQPINPDPEAGNDPDGHHDHPQSAPNQSLQGESTFCDSSGKLFSIYSDVAKDEDNKMVERWQKDADGILIFTGLFSAAVAALLAVTVMDLRPNSQDTSAFYLGNIYGVLADPNATRASPIAKPPPFSRPRYAVWVNSLWFLSLVMSLSCALWATLLHQWARRYIRLTQPARCSPEKRARMRAFFANGVDEMHTPLAVEGLPALLHFSLFLFFGGLAIFLFNVDYEVFICVVLWIGLFSVVYILITVLPLIRLDSPYHTPLSMVAWFPYTSIRYATFKVLASITFMCGNYDARERYCELRDRYRGWISRSMEKIAEEEASERSSDVDIGILDWTISALGDDDSLEKFFEAIPGFFNSRLVDDLRGHLSGDISTSSGLHCMDSWAVKLHRFDIGTGAMNLLPDFCVWWILRSFFFNLRGRLSQNIEIVYALANALARWCTSNNQDIAQYAQLIVASVLTAVRERDDRWVALAASVGLSERDVREYVTRGDDSVSLAILIQISRKAYRLDLRQLYLEELTQFDIRDTLSGLQHDFCTLWNEIVQEAKKQGTNNSIPVNILRQIRHLYIALHQGTDAAPTAFSPSTDSDFILLKPSSYPLCNIASHRQDSIVHVTLLTQPALSLDAPPGRSTSGRSTVNNAVAGPPSPSHPTTPSEIGDSSPPPCRSRFHERHSPPAATLTHPLEGIMPRDVVVSCTEPADILSASTTAPAPTLALIPASKPPVLKIGKSSESYDAGSASASKPSLPASSVIDFPIPPPPSRAPPLSNAGPLSLLGSMTPSRPTENATLPRLRARGLVNTGSMCFANSVLQLLVHSPSFWNLFRELGGLTGQLGVGGLETGRSATPLVDATASGGKLRGHEDAMKEHKAVDSFEPMYVYDAMNLKEKRQLKYLLDGQQQDAEEFFRLYLDSIDEELLALLASISGHKLATAAPRVGHEVSQSGQTDVGRRVESIGSPLMRIIGGKSRSTVRAPNQLDIVKIEDWRSLRLDIQKTHSHASLISNLFSSPSGFSEASQQVLIEALPPLLVLHFKRFLYDVDADGIVKISKHVQFGPELEIPPEMMAPVAGKSAEPVYYKLYGVLYHHGKSAGSGTIQSTCSTRTETAVTKKFG